jgi:hypothetical protein
MATRADIENLYRTVLGREPDAAGVDYWAGTGQDLTSIRNLFSQAPEAQVVRYYKEQLGRTPDEAGLNYWLGQLNSGVPLSNVLAGINTSLEGQNFDTQVLTSLYRQELARNPEQEGFQYWKSLAQEQGLSEQELRQAVDAAAAKEQQERNINGGFTNMELAALESDPYGGRYATTSIYDLPTDAVNISMIGDRQAQFVTPVTQAPVISQYGGGTFTASPGQNQFTAKPGEEVLSDPVVLAAMNRAVSSGALSNEGLAQIVNGLKTANNIEEVRNILATPQAQVVIDAVYGQQTGEDVDLATAQAEALERQAVLDANDTGFYQGNFELADAYRAAGLDFPFGPEAFQGYDTMMRQPDVVTPQNFNERVNSLLRSITGQFGETNQMQTPGLGQYYSESGLQPGFTPFGTEGTTFRSGVAGYVPQSQLPTGFQFGAPPVNATVQQYRPGAFQPAGVTTGGFITGYNTNGTPIYSTYANPNTNVGGAMSALNPFTPVQAGAIGDIQAQIDAINAAAAAAAAQQANLQAG